MKVTALLPDNLVQQVVTTAQGKNLTDSLLKALREWLAIKKVNALHVKLSKKPLEFHHAYSAEGVRSLNRKK